MGTILRKLFFIFCFFVASQFGSVFAETREEAQKWLKNAKDTLQLVEKTANELIQGGIEKAGEKDPAIRGEWQSAKEWLSLAKNEIKKAEDLCSKEKWEDCAHSANWAWQLLVKCATAAINAGRAAGLK